MLSQVPDSRGRFGPYGGQYVPETLMYAIRQLAAAYDAAKADPKTVEDLACSMAARAGPIPFT